VEVVGGVKGLVGGRFLSGDGWVEFSGGDLFGGGVDETELAGGEVVFRRAHGRAEGAAEDGARAVEVAGALVGVECGAGLVVGELLEESGGFVVFGEDAGGAIAGEPWVQAGEGRGNARADSLRAFGIGLSEEHEAFAEAGCVLLGDGEDADAALRAAGAADKVMGSAAVGVGYGGVDDLDEGCGVGCGLKDFFRVHRRGWGADGGGDRDGRGSRRG
jgi:hypothetical protein